MHTEICSIGENKAGRRARAEAHSIADQYVYPCSVMQEQRVAERGRYGNGFADCLGIQIGQPIADRRVAGRNHDMAACQLEKKGKKAEMFGSAWTVKLALVAVTAVPWSTTPMSGLVLAVPVE